MIVDKYLRDIDLHGDTKIKIYANNNEDINFVKNILGKIGFKQIRDPLLWKGSDIETKNSHQTIETNNVNEVQRSGSHYISKNSSVDCNISDDRVKRLKQEPSDQTINAMVDASDVTTDRLMDNIRSNINAIKREVIDVSDEEVEVVEQKPPKKRLKVSDNKQEEQNCNEISEQMIDYYLVLCLKQCLTSNDRQISIGDRSLLRKVDKKLKRDHKIELNSIECEVRFEEVFSKYLRVLLTAKSIFEASLAFKCFDLLNDIDFEELSEPKHRLIKELRNKLIASETYNSNDSEYSSDQPIRVKTEKQTNKENL